MLNPEEEKKITLLVRQVDAARAAGDEKRLAELEEEIVKLKAGRKRFIKGIGDM